MQALERHVGRLYARSGIRVMALVELAHVERTEPAADSSKEPTVTMRISNLEIPAPDQEESIREVMRALHLQRTSTGTIDDAGNLELSKQTIKDAGGIIGNVAIARMAAGINHWKGYIRRVQVNDKLTIGELRHELDAIADGLAGLLGAPNDPEGES